LLQAEAAHVAKIKGGPAPATGEPEPSASTAKRGLENGDAGDGEDPEAKRRRILEETRDIDAESEDDGEDDSSEDDSDDDEDETAELQRELEKIKRERAEKREQEVGTCVPREISPMADTRIRNERRLQRKRLPASMTLPSAIPF
jgi:protein CWC15